MIKTLFKVISLSWKLFLLLRTIMPVVWRIRGGQ